MSSESPEVERPGAELGRILLSAEWLPPGTRVDRWEVVGRLGAGGYGTTYSVRRAGRMRGRLYALKLSRRPGERWFAREVALLARVRHRSVVRLVTHGAWRLGPVEHPYLVMEYVDGESLYDWALARNPTARQVARLLVQVLEALAAAHREGALHRDFKGDNVLVAADGKVKLLDWGAGWYAGAPSLTATAQLPPGSPRYYSPQLLRWRALAERRPGDMEPYRYAISDELYAVGVTFHHLLTDQYPALQWLAPQEPLSPHGLHPLRELNPRLPGVLESVVLRLLAFLPEHRPEGAAVLAGEVRRALAVADTAWDAPLFDWRERTSSGSRTTFEAAEARGPVMPGQEVALREARARHVEEVHRWREARELRHRDPEKVAAAEARALAAVRRRGTSGSSHSLIRGGLGVLLVGTLVAGLTLWKLWEGPSSVRPDSTLAPVKTVQLMAPSARLDQARAPLTGTPPLSPTQQEKEDMSIRAPRQTAVVSPAGRSQALKRCSLVGAAALAACAGSQVRPDPSRCPDGALEAMRELNMEKGGGADIYTDANLPGAASKELLVREGPIVSMLIKRFGKLPVGTRLHGRLWTGGPQVTGRYTRAELPDRRSYPVCLVFGNIDGFEWASPHTPGAVTHTAAFTVVDSFP
ncbi:serine/threonine-protein kinase [Corallococcus terminator]|uniref:non-specific serine/threonine protein kinase n=1 Tax=Corallococcus terminator TaxID=2316733 RepID=A0A3A8ISI2_9BACT|nr:serine/threonine-protein kinase [Corallococcus terminator]RKG86262.1 serine/threonine protein kinase [Corallococcus terminator]